MLGALMVYTRDTLTHRKFISGAQWEGVGCGIAEMWFFWSLVSYGLFKTFLPRYWPGAMPLIPPGILAFITTGMVYSQRTRKVALIAILTIAVAASIRFLILPFFSGS